MLLEQPLALDAAAIAAAVRVSRPPKLEDWKSASLCRPIPATAGTSDTFMPGTPRHTFHDYTGWPRHAVHDHPRNAWHARVGHSRHSSIPSGSVSGAAGDDFSARRA
jgi:hypothetical protein